jgi:hypothetical protein
MKTVRDVASVSMLVAGVLHLLSVNRSLNDPVDVIMLVFGITYIVTAALLYLNLKYVLILGIVIPFLGLGTGISIIGPEHVSPVMGIMGLMDVIVIACCIFLLLKTKKQQS